MKCWNCLNEIPEAAKWCNFCESSQNRIPTGSPEDVKRALKNLGPELTLDLEMMAAASETCEEFQAMALVGSCPACGSSKTEDCDNDPEINSILLARCKECAVVFCPDCDLIYGSEEMGAEDNDCPSCGNQEAEEQEDADNEIGWNDLTAAEMTAHAEMLGLDEPVEWRSPSCSVCGSTEVHTCENTPGINSTFVLQCEACRSMSCTECGGVFAEGSPEELGKTCRRCGSSNLDTVGVSGEKPMPEALRDRLKLNVIIHCADCGADFCVCCGRALSE